VMEALTGSPPETCSFGFDMRSENSKLREPVFASEIWASLGTLTWVVGVVVVVVAVAGAQMIVVATDQGAGNFPF
jgi:hypothetical protein